VGAGASAFWVFQLSRLFAQAQVQRQTTCNVYLLFGSQLRKAVRKILGGMIRAAIQPRLLPAFAAIEPFTGYGRSTLVR
jgi:hypothetical protein